MAALLKVVRKENADVAATAGDDNAQRTRRIQRFGIGQSLARREGIAAGKLAPALVADFAHNHGDHKEDDQQWAPE